MDIAEGVYTGEAHRRRHLRLGDATGPAIRHRQRCRDAERTEDHVLQTRSVTDPFVEGHSELAVGLDDHTLRVTRLKVTPDCDDHCHD